MSWLEELAKAIQKPQSVLSGGILGAGRYFGLADPTSQYVPEADNPLTGLLAGLKGNIRPHDLINESGGVTTDEAGLGQKIANTISDIGVDPLLLAGPALKGGALGSQAAGAASKAFSVGKAEEGAKLSTAALRALRRTYQGTLATGDPLLGLATGQLIGVGENALGRLLPKLATKAATSAPEIADTLEDVPSAIRELGPGPVRGRAPGWSGTTHPEGEVITPDMIIRELGGPARGELGPGRVRGRLPGQSPEGTVFTPDRVFKELPPASKIPLNSGPIPMAELNPASAIAMPAGPRPMGPVLEELFTQQQGPSVEDLLDKMYGKGRKLKIPPDQIAQAFRDALGL